MALRDSPSNPETRGFRAFPYRCIRLLIKADFFAYAKITFPVKREGHFIGMLFFPNRLFRSLREAPYRPRYALSLIFCRIHFFGFFQIFLRFFTLGLSSDKSSCRNILNHLRDIQTNSLLDGFKRLQHCSCRIARHRRSATLAKQNDLFRLTPRRTRYIRRPRGAQRRSQSWPRAHRRGTASRR